MDNAFNTIPSSAATKNVVPPEQQPHMLERIVDGAHHTIDQLAEQAAPIAQQLEETVTGANQKLHERADQARELGEAWMGNLRDTVREHPVAALATAVAAGVLISRLSQAGR